MKCEIDIDLGKLADEWEPVRIGLPVGPENYLVASRGEVWSNAITQSLITRLIVRRRWQWPEWLTAEWYFESAVGRQFVANNEPHIGERSWRWWGAYVSFDKEWISIPKIGGDWRQSKRRNPRAK